MPALIIGCSSAARYHQADDSSPSNVPILEHVENAHPRYEPYSLQGNKDYTVRGKDYKVWRDISEYQVDGISSWYGAKFHGYLTSNGEVYNMYSMSAAHKNLPLPSYVKVTNKDNGLSVIVRINDRGPFHSERELDLSYAAAYKLKMLDAGTANIQLELIKMQPGSALDLAFTQDKDYMLQLAALGDKNQAQMRLDEIAEQLKVKGQLIASGTLFRLQLGPFTYEQATQQLATVKTKGYPNAYMLKPN